MILNHTIASGAIRRGLGWVWRWSCGTGGEWRL